MRSIRFFSGLERLVNIAAILCGYACLGLCLLIGYEIVARRLLGHSIQGVDELGGYVLAITSAVGFSAALMHRMHTRIELGLNRFPIAIQAGLNTIAVLLLAGFAVFMLLQVWGTWQSSIAYGSRASTPLQTPLWIPQGVWMLGVTLFALVAAAMLLHSLWLLAGAHYQTLNDRYGPPSLQDEVEKSLAEAESQLENQFVGKGERP
ncbi:TRAP transporter small permease subunit [Halomonas dongshanensis]|uniref:TRAP transporter small permease protein n=1 Tax=Halomonas dongshanensis TaxID=2890835 RepID=A0ABT2E9V4_9GAMM|nr:TRAP transporter small permease [Halomonas dongshanensis]MCS2608133.1 TRAP transporter small permease [Halomonas dongshanensis]